MNKNNTIDNREKFFKALLGDVDDYVVSLNSRKWSSTNEHLISTKSVKIGYDKYCPYCGEHMLTIEDEFTLYNIGECCMCDGAIKEIEYEKSLKKLEEEYDKKVNLLRNDFKNSVEINIDKLKKIKLSVINRELDRVDGETKYGIDCIINDIERI